MGTAGKDDYYGYGRINIYETVRPPHFIADINDINEIRNHLNWYYVLCQDTDATSTISWDNGKGFDPIPYFVGILDGSGYIINGFYINRPDEDKIGLFACLSYPRGIIQDLGLTNVIINGHDCVGALVGGGLGFCAEPCEGAWIYSIVNSCYSTGAITGRSYVGGLVGYEYGSRYYSSYSSCNVTATGQGPYMGQGTGQASVGGFAGLIGWAHGCYATGNVVGCGRYVGGFAGHGQGISKCYATGNVDAIYVDSTLNFPYYVGGFVGKGGVISDCYATGNVTIDQEDSNYIGGFVGEKLGFFPNPPDPHAIERCYSNGAVSGSPNAKGFCGHIELGQIIDCYWDIETSGQSTSDGGTGKTTTEMKQSATFAGWNFNNIWDIDEGVSYPYLRN